MKAKSLYLLSVLVCCVLGSPVKETSHKKRQSKGRFVPKYNRSACTGMGICNDTLSYPVDFIQKLVKRKKNLKLFSKVSLIEPADEIPLPTFRDTEPDNLCRTKTVTIFPKAAYDLHSNEYRFIVNIRDFEQSLVYETCVDENKECIDKEILPFDFQTLCKQKYNVVRLVSLTVKGKLEYGKFLVPSTCVCSYFSPHNNEMTNALF